MGLDVLFFIAVGFFTRSVVLRMQEYLLKIAAVLSVGLNEVSRSDSIANVFFSADALPLWKSWFLYWLLFILIVYVIYVLIQSVVWNLSLRIAGRKSNFAKYFVSFVLLNLFWFFIFIVYNLMDLIGDLRSVLLSGRISLVSVLAGLFLLFFAYFAVISYVKLNLKKSFVFGWKRYRELVPSFFYVFIYFFVLNFILSKLVLLNYTFAVVAGIVLFVPAVSFARIYLSLNINKVK